MNRYIKRFICVQYKFIVVSLCAFIIFTMCGCKKENKDILSSEGLFLKLTYTFESADEDIYKYSINVEFNNNGSVRIYADNFAEQIVSETEIPIEEYELGVDETQKLIASINENDVFSLNSNVGSRDLSGDKKFLTLYRSNGSTFTTGGVMPSNRKFLSVYEEAYNLVVTKIFVYTSKLNEQIDYVNTLNQYNGMAIYDVNDVLLIPPDCLDEVYMEEVESEKSTATDTTTTDADSIYQVCILYNEAGAEALETATATVPITLYLYNNGAFFTMYEAKTQIVDGKIVVYNNLSYESASLIMEQLGY